MSRRLTRFPFALVAALALPAILALPSVAHAEPSLSDRETARSLMDDGDAKRDKNDLKGALKSYEAADAIMHVPTTGLEVAKTQVQLGLLLEARETMGRVLRTLPKPGEPPAFATARKQVEQLNTEVGARIPSVIVQIANAEPGQPVVVVFDGEVVPPAAASAPRKVNPGKHVVQARSGSLDKSEEIVVAEKETKTVTIDLKAASVATTAQPPPEDTTPGKSPLPKILVFGGFGLGVVGVAIGTITGLSSISKVDDVKKDCNGNSCPPSREDDLDSARSLGTVSTIAFIAGGIGIGAGVLGLVLLGKQNNEPPPAAARHRANEPRTPASAFTFRPELGPTWVGAHGTF